MVMGPANLPKPIATKLAAAFIQAANSPDVRAKLLALNTDVVASSPEQARAFLEHEIARWAKVARDKKISED